MENQNKINLNKTDYYSTSDIKLQAFLRLQLPSLFIGINKNNPKRVMFLFKNSPELIRFVKGYFNGEEFRMSPLKMASYLDQAKALIYNDFNF